MKRLCGAKGCTAEEVGAKKARADCSRQSFAALCLQCRYRSDYQNARW